MEQPFSFRSAGVTLRGTLELPGASPPRAAALLLSGSGPQDRDQSIGEQPSFAVLSGLLADLGFAVLRWDDRGVGESAGDYLGASADLLCDDIEAALARLDSVVPGPALLVGHSQGTLLATRVAARRPERVLGLVLLAGMALPGRRTLLDQHRAIVAAEGWPEDEIESSLALKRALFDVLSDSGVNGDERALAQALRTLLGGGVEHEPDVQREIDAAVEDLLEWEWRFLLATDPADDLGRVRCPVLALTGDRDLNVAAPDHLAALEAALPASQRVPRVCRVVEGANHLFQRTDDGRPEAWFAAGPPFAGAFPARLREGLERLGLLDA